MMYIEKVEWSSETADEAIVLVTDGSNKVAVFSHPFSILSDKKNVNILYPMNMTGVRKSLSTEAFFHRHNDGLAHDVRGLVVNRDIGVVKVGGILLQMPEIIPGDIHSGDAIEFSCIRIDL